MTPLVIDVAREVAFGHQLIVGNRQVLRHVLLERMDAGERDLVLDCTGVGYIDTSGIGTLLSMQKRAREIGGSLALVGLTEEMRHYLDTLCLTPLFTLYPTLADVPGLGVAGTIPSLPVGREGTVV